MRGSQERKFLFGFGIANKSVEKLHKRERLRIKHFSKSVTYNFRIIIIIIEKNNNNNNKNNLEDLGHVCGSFSKI